MSSRADGIEYLIQILFRNKSIGQGTREKHEHKREVYKNYIHVYQTSLVYFTLKIDEKRKGRGINHITHKNRRTNIHKS